MMTHYAKLYLVTLLALVIDGIWLGLIARGFYGRYLGYLLKPNQLAGGAAVLSVVCRRRCALRGSCLTRIVEESARVRCGLWTGDLCHV